jgi:RNA polymerase sigma-70 factor, ECF subfamily
MNAPQNTPGKPILTLYDSRRSYAQMTDVDLVVACQGRDRLAFDQLVKRNHRVVYGLLHQLAPDWRDSNDLAQEVFIRIWKSIGNLRNPHSFKTWLSHIVTNLFYDELRKRPKQPMISIDAPLNAESQDEPISRDLPDVTRMPEELLQQHELSDAIDHAIAKLPEQFRTTILLREIEGLSYEEIAAITHTEKGTVKSRIARARAKIQHTLEPYMQDCA